MGDTVTAIDWPAGATEVFDWADLGHPGEFRSFDGPICGSRKLHTTTATPAYSSPGRSFVTALSRNVAFASKAWHGKTCCPAPPHANSGRPSWMPQTHSTICALEGQTRSSFEQAAPPDPLKMGGAVPSARNEALRVREDDLAVSSNFACTSWVSQLMNRLSNSRTAPRTVPPQLRHRKFVQCCRV